MMKVVTFIKSPVVQKTDLDPKPSVYKNQKSQQIEIPERLPLYGSLDIVDFTTYHRNSRKRFLNMYEKSCPYLVQPEDFNVISILGKGAFGKVMLVQGKKNSNFYAMKALEKRHIVLTKQVAHALNEKRILQCIDFPFGVRMEYFAKDNSYIYFFMPFISGGEMFTHLQKMGRFSEKMSKFYAAQVVLGLEYLHYLNLVYRDLKPENLLLDYHGFLKITDFGFTKPVVNRTYTFCGTPHYLAPEVITGHGYGHSVDWWSLGVLIYEMNAGYPPYDGREQMIMFKLILQNRYVTPTYFSDPLRDIIDKLLQIDITRRYGNLRQGSKDIKDHAWFSDINWLDIFNRKPDAPFVPPTTGQGDIRHFPSIGQKESLLKVSMVNEFEKEFRDF